MNRELLLQTVLKAYYAMMRKIVFLGCLLFLVALTGKGWHWIKSGFHLARIQATLPQGGDQIPPAIEEVLDQSYLYLGKGRQFYAFSSQDGKYVLKFPRMDCYEAPLWMRISPAPLFKQHREKIALKKKARRDFLWESSRIAFEEIPDLTGVLFLHLTQTKGSHSTRIFDSLGRAYTVDLDRLPYVLQKRQPLLEDKLKLAINKKDRTEAKRILEGFLNLIDTRSGKGFFNKDRCYLANYGYDGEKGVEIDIGSFYRVAKENPKKPVFRDTIDPVIHFLQNSDPELTVWFEARAKEFCKL